MVAGHLSPGTTSRATRARITSRPCGTKTPGHLAVDRQSVAFRLRSPALGEFAEAFRVGRRPLGEYLHQEMIAPNIDNTITRFLVWPHPLLHQTRFIEPRHDEELFAMAVDRLDSFAHVGMTEDASFMSNLGGWLGRELHETRLNERTAIPRSRRRTCPWSFHLTPLSSWRFVRGSISGCGPMAPRKTLDADPTRVLSASWEKAMSRYADTPASTRRLCAEWSKILYGLKTRLAFRGKDRSPQSG